MNIDNMACENRLETNPYVHYLQEGDLLCKSKNELILKHLHELPHDFMEMTLFDVVGNGDIYTFSHISDLEGGGIQSKVAVYKKR